MTTKLGKIEDWNERAHQANWSVSTLANRCQVSMRTLERWFRQVKETEPREWMHKERHRRALELLLDGSSVKETAFSLGYKTSQHFSREFKMRYGVSPNNCFQHK